MQKELDEAAAQGFRILVGSPTSGTEMALLLERVADQADAYTYRLLATTRTGTMQKELTEAALDGFRLLPRTMVAKKQMLGGVEIVVILERPQKADKLYRYKLLATNLTSTLQKEVIQSPGRRLCSGWDGQSRRAHGDYGTGNTNKGVKYGGRQFLKGLVSAPVPGWQCAPRRHRSGFGKGALLLNRPTWKQLQLWRQVHRPFHFPALVCTSNRRFWRFLRFAVLRNQ